MAELNKTVLGKVRGSIGELTFRQRNGKNLISMKPSSFIPGSDPNSIARRDRFKLTIKLAKELNNIPFIKEYWNSVSPAEMTGFNLMFKVNYQNVSSNDIVSNPVIIPVSGFNISNPTCVFNADNFEISIGAIGNISGIDTLTETNLSLVNILFLNNPLNPTFETNLISVILSENIALQLDNPLNFTVNIPNNILHFYNNYQTKKVFSVLLTSDAANQVIHFSNTFSV